MILVDDDVIKEVSKETSEVTCNHTNFMVIRTKMLDKLGSCCALTELEENWDDEVILGFLMGILAVQKQMHKNI